MIAEDAAQQVIAQNLANVSTIGYKQDVPIFKSFDENLISLANEDGDFKNDVGSMGNGSEFQAAVTDFSQGSLQQTGNPLDVALTGNAFLGVQTVSGTRYSRDGALTISPNGTLVQLGDGLPVLSDRGTTIQLPTNSANVHINPDGTVLADKVAVGRIGLFAISMAEVPKKIGGNLVETMFAPKQIDAQRDPSAGLRSGYLEQSNVNIVKEMVTMIAGLRAYEANSKALQSHDEVEDKSVNEIGKV